jgi:hypothetical protein
MLICLDVDGDVGGMEVAESLISAGVEEAGPEAACLESWEDLDSWEDIDLSAGAKVRSV